MSEIIVEWLQKDVKLPRIFEPSNLDTAFSSGYLFAAVFKSKHLLSEESLQTFIDKPSPYIAIRNFSKLEPIFRAIGIPLTSTVAYNIISCKPDAASKLLYQIKSTLSNMVSSDNSTAFGILGHSYENRLYCSYVKFFCQNSIL